MNILRDVVIHILIAGGFFFLGYLEPIRKLSQLVDNSDLVESQ